MSSFRLLRELNCYIGNQLASISSKFARQHLACSAVPRRSLIPSVNTLEGLNLDKQQRTVNSQPSKWSVKVLAAMHRCWLSAMISMWVHLILPVRHDLLRTIQEDLTPKTTKKVLDAFKKGQKPKPGPQSGRQTSENSAGLTTLTSKVCSVLFQSEQNNLKVNLLSSRMDLVNFVSLNFNRSRYPARGQLPHFPALKRKHKYCLWCPYKPFES